jgi:Effector-associated domain 7/SIR2-like domain
LSITIGDNAAKEQFLTFIKAFFVAQKVRRPFDFVINKYGRQLSTQKLSFITRQLGMSANGSTSENPLNILANLNIPIYLTTSYFNYMELALQQVGKKPQTEICLWNDQVQIQSQQNSQNILSTLRQLCSQNFDDSEIRDLCLDLDIQYENLAGDSKLAKVRELLLYVKRRQILPDLMVLFIKQRPKLPWPNIDNYLQNTIHDNATTSVWTSVFQQSSTYTPQVRDPLVYHLYGLETHPSSMVFTENNYLDFLVRVSQQKKLIPPVVSRTLVDSSLLLLGYRIHDWDFRTLFRGLISKRRSSRREISVAIQLEAGDYSKEAQAYLESYFSEVEFKVYWGSSQEFLSEIKKYAG